MSPCCGGGTAAAQILNAKRNLPPMGSYATAVEMEAIATTDQGKVRIMYTGERIGSVSYNGKRPGVVYRFGNNAMDRVHDVEPGDVEKLLGAGDFRLVPINSPSGPAGFIPAPDKPAEPLQGIEVKKEEAPEIPEVEHDPNAEIVAETETPTMLEPEALPAPAAPKRKKAKA